MALDKSLHPAWEKFNAWWQVHHSEEHMDSFKDQFTSHPLLSVAMDMNRTITVVTDLHSMKYVYLNGNTKEHLGWDQQHYLEEGVQFAFSKVHRDDIPAVQSFSEQINAYYQSLPEHEKPAHKAYWDARFVQPDGNYLRVIFQDCALKNDSRGNIALLLSLITNITNTKGSTGNHLRLTNGIENRLFMFDHAENKLHELQCPTDRELEVMRYVSQGYHRLEIAKRMSIALATVKTHCRHTYEKLRTNDSMDTINLLRMMGLI